MRRQACFSLFAVAAALLVVVFAVFRRLEPRMSDFV